MSTTTMHGLLLHWHLSCTLLPVLPRQHEVHLVCSRLGSCMFYYDDQEPTTVGRARAHARAAALVLGFAWLASWLALLAGDDDDWLAFARPCRCLLCTTVSFRCRHRWMSCLWLHFWRCVLACLSAFVDSGSALLCSAPCALASICYSYPLVIASLVIICSRGMTICSCFGMRLAL